MSHKLWPDLMQLSPFNSQQAQSVIQLFNQVFSASEGESEGQLVSDFVDQLMHTTPANDLFGFIVFAALRSGEFELDHG